MVNKLFGVIIRASDISRKKKQNLAGFSGPNSRKNRPISQDFRGKKVKIRGTISRFRGIFAGEKSKFAEKVADFAGNFGGKLRQETISKKQPISLVFFWQISLKSINFASIWPALVNVFFNKDNHLLFQQQFTREMSDC